jgi:hypothetical protein
MLKTALRQRAVRLSFSPRRWASTQGPEQQPFPPDNEWSHPPTNATVSDDEIYRLAAKPRRPLTLADLVKYAPLKAVHCAYCETDTD